MFCKCLEDVLSIPPNVLDNRQCFTLIRLDAKKKKKLFHCFTSRLSLQLPGFDSFGWSCLEVFFLLGAAWVKFRAERPSVSEVSGQLHVQIGCKLRIKRTRRIETSKQGNTNYELKQKNC